jgi:hypothetical protein
VRVWLRLLLTDSRSPCAPPLSLWLLVLARAPATALERVAAFVDGSSSQRQADQHSGARDCAHAEGAQEIKPPQVESDSQ